MNNLYIIFKHFFRTKNFYFAESEGGGRAAETVVEMNSIF